MNLHSQSFLYNPRQDQNEIWSNVSATYKKGFPGHFQLYCEDQKFNNFDKRAM